MFFVLGSGPASISAAVALANRGIKVTILDPGKTIEPERRDTLARVSAQEPAQWDPADLEFLRGGDQSQRHGKIHVKLTYGSDFPYGPAGEPLHDPAAPNGFHYSMARGGLSTVWGASLLPYRAQDIRDWPITLADLAPHYRAVLDFVPSTAGDGDFDGMLPAYTSNGTPFTSSAQAAGFLEDLARRRDRLNRAGIHFGRSRMAVAPQGDTRRHSCVYCGRCLYGCPYSLIYSSAMTLNELTDSGKVTYISGYAVDRIEQHGATVRIHARETRTSEERIFGAERVFAGCGILPTASIVLNSLELYNRPVEMLDSQYFIYPFFRMARTPAVVAEPLHSLAQLFIEIDDPAVSEHLVHMEIFSYSDFLDRALRETPLRFALANRWMADQILGRLLVVQGFLHSSDSARIDVELRKEPGGRPGLRVTPRPMRRSLWKSLRAGFKLLGSALDLRGIPALPGLQFAEPGRSYHSGGAFPMRKSPGDLETDTLGRLPAMDRVHLVDASVFPSIPATTITLSVMANAHRIASAGAEL